MRYAGSACDPGFRQSAPGSQPGGKPLPKFSLKLLGRFELSGPHGPVELPNKKLAALLAFLACSGSKPQSREKLATLLWGSHFEAQARQNLRAALFRLRRALGSDALIGGGDEISLAREVVDSDVARLEALNGEGTCVSLAAAALLYQAPLLSDLNIAEEAWNDWLGAERARLERLALDAMVRQAEQALQSDDAESAFKAAHRAISVNVLREDAHRIVLRALAATGRKAEALKHYQGLATTLRRELNTEPDSATRSLVAEIRRAQGTAGATAVDESAKSESSEANPPPLEETAPAAGLEQRQMTIMLCNIAGLAPLASQLDPEDVHDLVALFHKTVADAVARFDGFVAQYQGNGVLVYFGYPAAHEHDAERAVRAGLAALAASADLKSASGVALQASAGIASGLVVIGEPRARQRVAIGDTPDLAVRLQAEAAPGEVVIAASTQRLVGRMFDCRALDPIVMKGSPQPLSAWQVRGEAAGMSRFEARREGALSPMVGRQEEIDLLLRRWEQAKRGEGRVVLLSGEPGIGKSRLAESLVSALAGEPYARLRYSCSPHHVNSPLHPIISQLELAARFVPGSDDDTRLERLEATFKATSKNPSRDVALIAELLGVPLDGRFQTVQASPQEKREMLLAALLDQIEGLAAQGPVLGVLEDVHWIDPTSLELAERLVERAADRPLMMVVTSRQELPPAWADVPHVTTLALNRLGLRDSAAIVRGIVGDKELPDAIVEQIFAATDGVPLFTEELTAALLESGLLRETADGYVLDRPRAGLAIPTTLQGSLVARLDRLGPGKHAAMIGAVIGRQFSHQLIAAVSSLAPTDLAAALERLVSSGLVSRHGTPPDATYRFKHALTRDAAYGTMLSSRRRRLHAGIAKALVEQFTTLAESEPEVVARHYTEAGLAHEAIDYWVKAGRLAVARSAAREAVASFEQALQLLDGQPQVRTSSPRDTLELGIDVRFEVKDALVQLGEFERIFPRLHEAELLAKTLDDQKRLALAYGHLCHTHWMGGLLPESYRFGRDALAIARSLDDVPLQMQINLQLGAACLWGGDYRQGERSLRLVLERSDGRNESRSVRLRAAAHFYLTAVLAARGSFGEGAVHGQEGLRLAESEDRPGGIVSAYLYAADLETTRGDFSRSIALLEPALALCERCNLAMLKEATRSRLGYAYGRSGRLAEGIPMLEQAVRAITSMQHRAGSSFISLKLSEAYLLADRLSDALDYAQRSLSIARQAGQRGHEATATWLLGEIAVAGDCPEQAEGHYRHALALGEKLGFRPMVAHCHRGLGNLYRRQGKLEQASKHLTAATTMYRAMGMHLWL
ncbi:MAG: AAA family ATPase [Alphaproteobacteria bacterium]|nr:AAA family ATPase [Alphaproteobacteria bacterium]